jgi:adhesin transport system outer membrane protein
MRYILYSAVMCFSAFTQAGNLHDLIHQTVNSHPDVLVERARQAVASTELELANEQYYPTFSVSFENAAMSRSNDVNYSGANQVTTFRLQQPLYTFGRLDAGREKSAAALASQNFTIEETKLQLAQAVLQAWGDWYVATLRADALDKSITTHEALRDSVARRADKGASSPSEVRLSVARLAQVQAQIINVQLQSDAAKVKIEQLTGQPISSDTAPKQYLDFELKTSTLMTDSALNVSPTLMRFAADIQRSEAAVKEEKASLAPEIYLRAEHQRGDFSTSIPFSNRIFVGMQSNFGAGLSALKQVQLAGLKTATLQAEVKVVERNITERVRLELTQLNLLDVRQAALELSLSANTDIAEAFNRQYLAGRRSWVEVMNTARELSQAELELADLKAAKVLSYWRLAFLVKGLDATLVASQPTQMK